VITAIDSSVLIDVFVADLDEGERSGMAIRRALAEGSLIACDIVVAEVAAHFADTAHGSRVLRTLEVAYDPLSEDAAWRAGQAWRTYRSQGGHRQRLIADFLIGAHALIQADRLLTRDRGFYRTYFADLIILDPSRS
jgi:predicted nucleic acid-binding protein